MPIHRLSCLIALAAVYGCTTTSNGTPNGNAPDGSMPAGDDGGTSADGGANVMPSGSDGGAPDATTSDGGAGGADGSVTDEAGPDGYAAEASAPVIGTGPTPPTTLPTVMLTGSSPCTISSPTTWTAGVYVVNCNNELEIDSVLTINQGTVIKFAASNYIRVTATGTINSLGGSAYPIVYTSLKDDAHGGDTNGDANATTPAPGDWTGIELDGTNNSMFGESGFYYTGASTNGALVDNGPAPVTVTNSVFAHNKPMADAITAAPALNLSNAPAGSVVTGNVFYDNRVPLGIPVTISLDDSNSFDNSAAAPSQPQPNEYNGVVVNTGPNIDGHVSWTTTKVPIVVPSPWVGISSTGTLSLGDGAILKFGSGAYVRVAGVLSSPGNHGIVFTSLKDDAHGGDTNGDGAATTPTSGDWNGVTLAGSTGTNFNATEFYYAGGGDGSALAVGSTAASITKCKFGHNKSTTDAITGNATLDLSQATAGTVVTGNVFYDNRVPVAIASSLSIDDSNSFDNAAAASASPQPNEYNAIVVSTGPSLVGNVSWKATKVPFALAPWLVIDGSSTLTLGNNVTLKFFAANNSGVRIVSGGVLTAGTGVVLTSIRDDAHGGDTNADGNATMAAAGDWWGVAGAGTSGLGSTSPPALTCDTFGTEYYAACE